MYTKRLLIHLAHSMLTLGLIIGYYLHENKIKSLTRDCDHFAKRILPQIETEMRFINQIETLQKEIAEQRKLLQSYQNTITRSK